MIFEQTAQERGDPIAALVSRARTDAGARPAPLVATEIDVTITGGLALVEKKQTFRNGEVKSIEALLSFPVPIHAAFFGLTVKIDGRTHKGVAQAREEARATYENAIDQGRAAVLHEELLRGVHSLSVGNLAPGASVDVTSRWAEALCCVGRHERLRIPLTVGDVYGISGLPETDELIHGGTTLRALLRVRHDARSVGLADGVLEPAADGFLRAEVCTDAPIDLVVEDWKPGMLSGRAWDGREVMLRIRPGDTGDKDLNLAILVDHSGSMSSPCAGLRGEPVSKHGAVKRGLLQMLEHFQGGDRIALWEFDHECDPVGQGQLAPAAKLVKTIKRLRPPSGGTEIGGALDRICKATETSDVLLITDGLSYALDVHHHARVGRRIFVVLVGEDSLEANVGHLAALTGGDVHFSFGLEVGNALCAALQGLRSKRAPLDRAASSGGRSPERVVASHGNVWLEATWSGQAVDEGVERDERSEAVAAPARRALLCPRWTGTRPVGWPSARVSSLISPAWCWSMKPSPGRKACRQPGRWRYRRHARWNGRCPAMIL